MDTGVKFWTKWISEQNSLKKPKLLKTMAIVRDLVDFNYGRCKKISRKDWTEIVTQNLNDIFQDLADVVGSLERNRVELESTKKKGL